VVVGELLQPCQLGVDLDGSGDVGVQDVGSGLDRVAPWLIDDASIQALIDQEAKPVQRRLAAVVPH